MQTADVTKRAEHAYSPAIILAPQWWVGLLLALLAGTACTARVHSTVPPTERLECSAAEAPIIVEYDKWRVPVWECGPRPCPPDREAVWFSGTRPECRVPCESGRPRREGGSCPGQYSLDEKLDGDLVTVIATVDGRPVSGVKVAVASDSNRRTPLMHKTTDAAGVAQFNLANEPLHSVLESFVDFQVKNHTLLKDLELTANFRDGSTADCRVSVHDSTSVRQLRARAEEASRAEKKDTWSEALQKCTQGDAQTCFDVAVAISRRSDAGSRAEADGYMQRACDLHLQIACDNLTDKRREAEQKRKCDEGDGASCNAAGYFRRACALGFEQACETLRTYPGTGKRHEQDPERAPVPAASTAEASAAEGSTRQFEGYLRGVAFHQTQGELRVPIELPAGKSVKIRASTSTPYREVKCMIANRSEDAYVAQAFGNPCETGATNNGPFPSSLTLIVVVCRTSPRRCGEAGQVSGTVTIMDK